MRIPVSNFQELYSFWVKREESPSKLLSGRSVMFVNRTKGRTPLAILRLKASFNLTESSINWST